MNTVQSQIVFVAVSKVNWQAEDKLLFVCLYKPIVMAPF